MAVHKLERRKGLDLFLHTPGGSISSTQSIVDYLHKMFGKDIRAIIPQIAMSAGTMIACSCKEIWMGKHSNLGPIDPQVNGIPAYGVLREFKTACKEVKSDPAKTPIWQSIIGQYRPTFLSRCENAIAWSNDFVREQLTTVMFEGMADARQRALCVVRGLTHYSKNKTTKTIFISRSAKNGFECKTYRRRKRFQRTERRHFPRPHFDGASLLHAIVDEHALYEGN